MKFPFLSRRNKKSISQKKGNRKRHPNIKSCRNISTVQRTCKGPRK